MTVRRAVEAGLRTFYEGTWAGQEIVLVLSRVGKVSAAATTLLLLERFGCSHIVFTGVAGAVDPRLHIGDVVIADRLVQHDMDATPLFPRYEVPLTGQSHFASDMRLTDALSNATRHFVSLDVEEVISPSDRASFRLGQPIVHRGLIASGDEFIDSRNKLAELKSAFPALLAVEMEGAAVAQVCFEFGVPFAVVRTISDGANEEAPVDFLQFIERVAARYAFGIVKRLCAELSKN